VSNGIGRGPPVPAKWRKSKGLGYSKDLEMHKCAVALYFGVYNFVRPMMRSEPRQRLRQARS